LLLLYPVRSSRQQTLDLTYRMHFLGAGHRLDPMPLSCYYFRARFLPATVRRTPRRVRALVRVR
jgi:hypothetical protein